VIDADASAGAAGGAGGHYQAPLACWQ